MKYLVLCISLISISCTTFCQDKILIDLQKNVSESSLKETIFFLASDKCQGRMASTHGDSIAANYVENIMKKQGLVAAGDKGYRQYVSLTPMIDNFSDLTIDGKTYIRNLTWSNGNFGRFARNRPGFYTENFSFKDVPIVFANYGIDDSAYNDYSNINVKDKIVIVVNGSPTFLNKKIGSTAVAHQQFKLQPLSKKNAFAVWLYRPNFLFDKKMKTTFDTIEARMLCKLTNQVQTKNTNLPITMLISKEMIYDILGNRKGAFDSLLNNFDNTKKYQAIETGKTASLSYSMDVSNQLSSPNILGMIKGSDPTAGYIVFTAHRDHEGQALGATWYGADDDASGTAMMLECAKSIAALAKKGTKPKKSILFISTTAEEHGKLGAKYFLENPTIPLAQIKYNVNADMVGRIDSFHTKKNDVNPYIYPVYYDSLYNFNNTIATANKSLTKITLDYHYLTESLVSNQMNRSDCAEFTAKKIPALYFFSGYHPDYHTPRDTPDKIDYALLKTRTEFALLTLWELANE
jgi:hypothetical protein